MKGLCNGGQAAKAEEPARRLLETYPDAPALHGILGAALTVQGRLSEATARYRRARDLAPGDARAHVDLGNVCARLGALEEAAACYRQALQIDPNRSRVHSNLGNALALLGRLEEAAASFRQAISIEPNLVQAHSNLGTALTELGRSDEAETSLRHAIALDPANARAHGNLGRLQAQQGKIEEAAATYQRAITINPNIAEMHNNLGVVLTRLGRAEEALASFGQALKLKPDAETHYNAHVLLLGPDDVSPAIRCLEAAVNLQPGNFNYKLFLGMLLEYAGEADRGAAYLEEVDRGSDLDKARLDAWNYMKSAQEKTPRITGSLIETFCLAMEAAPPSGLVLEFGVRHGVSIRQIAALTAQQVHGVDSFEGLPERWHNDPKGTFTTKGVLPDVPENVALHRGWFEETLPEFARTHQDPVRFMNVDCDLYSSTKTILDGLARQIVPGTVIVFDEYIGNDHWREDEFKAFQEAVSTYGWKYEYLAFSMYTKQVVVRMI